MGYYMSEYFQNFSHLIKIYIQRTIQNSQTSERFCCLLYPSDNSDGYSKEYSCLGKLWLHACM